MPRKLIISVTDEKYLHSESWLMLKHAQTISLKTRGRSISVSVAWAKKANILSSIKEVFYLKVATKISVSTTNCREFLLIALDSAGLNKYQISFIVCH